MEFKGTKGKWYRGISTGVVSMSTQTKVAQADGVDYKESIANALLISKAPEMLEMLQWFVENFEGVFHKGTETDNKVNEAQQLVKQATEL